MIATIVCGFALCYAEVASTLPVSGSVYSYATIGEFVAHLMGWTLLSVYVVTTAAVAGGWTGYFHNLVSGLGLEIPKALLTIPSQGGIVNLPAVIVTLVITWLLSRGTKESKRVNNIMVLIKIGIVVFFIAFAPRAVFFAFLGFDALATSAEVKIRNVIPIGIIASLVICTIIYVVVCLVMTGMVSYKELDVPEAMAYVLEVVGQDKVAGIIAIGAVGIMAVIFYIYATTRVFFAMSRDGLLPESFAKINKDRSTNIYSLVNRNW